MPSIRLPLTREENFVRNTSLCKFINVRWEGLKLKCSECKSKKKDLRLVSADPWTLTCQTCFEGN